MTKQKLFKHVLPVLLSAVLLFSAMPMSVSAQDESPEEVASKIVKEVTELREENVKHFLCEDGSYIAATYSQPVHYRKNGKWVEIDNSLQLSSKSLSTAGKPTYTPKAADTAVSIPQSFADGQQITVESKGHTIGFGVASANENADLDKTAFSVASDALPSDTQLLSTATVSAVNAAEQNATATAASVTAEPELTETEQYNLDAMAVDNQAGAVVFEDVFPDSDLEYIVNSNSIKENIVVYQPQTEYTYSFDFDAGGLTPVAQEDGSITLVDSANQNEVVFVIAAPYMYDAGGAESYSVQMVLTPNGGEYLLTVTADASWINSGERTFPVVIDPTTYFEFNDAFVMDGILNQNTTKLGNELRVGRNLTNLTRTYIKPFNNDNSIIPQGCYVTGANLILTMDYYYQAPGQDDIDICLHDCYNMPDWSASTVTWNNQPFGNTENSHSEYRQYVIGAIPATSTKQTYTFDITEAVERWLQTGVIKGFMLASNFEHSKTQVDFHSSRSDVSNPLVQIHYSQPNLSQSRWDTAKDAATSPAISVNTTASWTASADQPWISLSATSGTGMSSFTVSVTENTSIFAREGEVTVIFSSGQSLKLKVCQSATAAYFSADKSKLFYSYKGADNPDNQEYWAADDYLTKVVNINTNYDWTVEVVCHNTTEQWLSDDKGEDGNLYLTVTKTNTANSAREATVYIKSGETVLHEIEATQLDEISSYFNQLDPDDPSETKNSSDYNHPLAQWAMALSYAAYNPVQSQFLPLIPSSFMQTPYNNAENTAKADLLSKGFVATEYNYEEGADIYAAHTIGRREITINDYNDEGDNNIDFSSNNDVIIGGIRDDSASFSSAEAYGNINSFPISGNSRENILNSTNNTRQLVVVTVRGSVTFMDWVVDLGNQFNNEQYNFQTGMKEIIKSLYGCTDLCDECNGAGCENAPAGYLDGINNPIILITGHSLGAAIANLTADYLTQKLGADNVYAYTFATPNTINNANDLPVTHTNIFNILNNNDFVPHFPMDDPGDEPTNVWVRHGQDFHITMPWNHVGIGLLDTDLLGVLGHGMPTYYAWMNNLPNTFSKPAEKITTDDLNAVSEDFAVGLAAKTLRAKCPVGVTLYDSDGNIVAFESQQEGAVYPEITDIGIVSWITEDGGKMFLIPYGTENIEARIEAYDYGTMTLTVEQPGIGEPLDTITYNNVNLYPDKEFKVDIAEEFDADEVALMHVVTNEDGSVTETEITDLDPYLKSVTIDDSDVVYKTTSIITVVTDPSVTGVKVINHSRNDLTTTYYKNNPSVTIVDEGDKRIWTIQKIFQKGTAVCGVSVRVGTNNWYLTENVFTITVS